MKLTTQQQVDATFGRNIAIAGSGLAADNNGLSRNQQANGDDASSGIPAVQGYLCYGKPCEAVLLAKLFVCPGVPLTITITNPNENERDTTPTVQVTEARVLPIYLESPAPEADVYFYGVLEADAFEPDPVEE